MLWYVLHILNSHNYNWILNSWNVHLKVTKAYLCFADVYWGRVGCGCFWHPKMTLFSWWGWISITMMVLCRSAIWFIRPSSVWHPDMGLTCKRLMRMNKNKVSPKPEPYYCSRSAEMKPSVFPYPLYCHLFKPEVGVHHPCGLNLCDLTFNSLYVHF